MMMGLDPETCNAVIWIGSQLGGRALNWWFNEKTIGQVPQSFTWLINALKKTIFLPNIKANAINSLMALI
jgi:hypothetical protein